jgi:putative transposase
LRSYPAAKAEISELINVKQVLVKASGGVNNCAETSHQPTFERERRIPQGDFLRGVRGFLDPDRTQALLSSFGLIRQHFALKRHVLRASLYCKQLAVCFATWDRFTGLTQHPSDF